MREGQRGFTVVEILLALAIALPVAITLLGVVRLASGGAEAARWRLSDRAPVQKGQWYDWSLRSYG